MKEIGKLSITMVLIFSAIVVVNAKEPKVKKEDNGLYVQHLNFLSYVADSETQACFVAVYSNNGSSISEINCETLAKRSEWRAVLTWVSSR